MAKIVPPPVEETLKQFDLDPKLASQSAAELSALNSTDPAPGHAVLPLTTEQKEAIAAEVVQIDAALERLTERREALKAIIREQVVNEGYGTVSLHSEAGIGVTIGHNSHLNKDRFMGAYPYEFFIVEDQIVEDAKGRKKIQPVTVYPNKKFYKIEPDTKAIKAALPEGKVATTEKGTPVLDESGNPVVVEAGWKAFYDENDPSVTFR